MQKTSKKVSLLVVLLAMAGLIGAVGANAATQTQSPNLSATVTETMVLACGDVTIAPVTAGLSQNASANCTATTNGAAGFNLKVAKSTVGSSASTTLKHTDTTTWITDTGVGVADLKAFDGTAATSIVWSAGSTKGLGIHVNVSGTTLVSSLASTIWGADDLPANAKYAALPAIGNNVTIYKYDSYTGSPATVGVNYKLDIPSTQKAGSYAGSVLYTATTN
ncbi:MAG: hypothetical protein WCJ51_00105 [Candidatus Moraniibacteriota bacterium]